VDKRCRLQCLLGSGRVLFNEGNVGEATRHLDESLKMARELNARPLEYETHRAFAALYESTGELRKSLEHYMEFHRIREEVHSAEAQNRMKEQQIAFAVEKSEKEKEIYHLRHVELKAAYDEITDSINYASRIQGALLPSREFLEHYLPEHFIMFLPRDIVSGDFYWATVLDSKIVFAAADCTGHGVPGAFMSMLGIAFLDEIVNKRGVISANGILFDLRKEVIKALKQTGKEEEQKDGMDIALCVYDLKNKRLEYSGAYNPLYLVRKGELTEYKADRLPISFVEDMDQAYTSHAIDIMDGDTMYIFSDGYPDQFGGPDGKKFKYKPLKALLLSIQDESLYIQKQRLEKHFSEWKGDLAQIDDVLLIGVRF
jgi:serine phosphatase RsbU (regulator of sigma subunit)